MRVRESLLEAAARTGTAGATAGSFIIDRQFSPGRARFSIVIFAIVRV
jgi:hypothetical protein